MAMHLTYKDVWLDYFINKQYLISLMISGDSLTIKGDELLDSNGKSVLKFSAQFKNQIAAMRQNKFELKVAKVNFIVYWQKEDTKQEIKIVLPELYFVRDSIQS
jgi:ATP-dependent DNA helicase RecQ